MSTAGPPARSVAVSRRRWLILAVIAVAQLMVVLDATVVNIALPSAQHALHFSDAGRQWIVSAYSLAFGILLLPGGKLGDLVGRKEAFLAGLLGFAATSAVGGAATSFGVLVAARACQGAFGALLAPAGLALLITTFPGRGERGTAFGIYGAIVSSGSAIGLLLGGVLTQYLSWRWCLYVNLVFGAVGLVGGTLMLERRSSARRARLDLPGTVAVCSAMFCLVYGFSNAEAHRWAAPSTWGFLVAGGLVLAAFVGWQSRSPSPLIPLRILAERNRSGAFLAVFFIRAAIAGVFLFLTYYLQGTRGYSPVGTGLAYLPMLVTASALGVLSNMFLLPRAGPRPLIAGGMLLAAAGLAWMTGIGLRTGYLPTLLGPLLVSGIGLGLALSPAMNTATFQIPPADAGVASGLANTRFQVGTSLGIALLNTLAVTATSDYLRQAAPGSFPGRELTGLALLHGYITGFWWAVAIFTFGAMACWVLPHGSVPAGPAATEPVAVGPGRPAPG